MSFFGPSLVTSQTTQFKEQNKQNAIRVKAVKDQRIDVSFIVKFTYVVYETIRVMLRALRLGMTFLPICVLYPVSYLGQGPQDLWWRIFVRAIEFSGPICVKFGQWASTRRDLFSDTCCSNLSRLQRRTNPHSWFYTKLRLSKAFGKNWRKIFVKFDNNSEPVGSGCVAQVYKVWMNENAIEDREILEEIIFDNDDDEDSTSTQVFDGLEVMGFHSMLESFKNIDKEQEEAIENYRKERSLKQESKKIEEVTNELAEDLVQITNEGEHTMEDNQTTTDDEVEQHVLTEQWQNDSETLDKSLPSTPDEPLNIEGLVPVAIKVLHPGVYSIFRRDLTVFKIGAHLFTLFVPQLRWISLPKCVEEFSKMMIAQIDLRIEANNLEKFTEAFSDIEYVRFPRPLRPYVSRSVLVETFEEGEPMLNFIVEQEKSDSVKKNLAKYGVDMLLKMVFQDNFVHGDLHPGNILVQNVNEANDNDGNENKLMMVDVGADIFVMDVQPDPNPMRICILDCGIVSVLKDTDLENLKGVFTHVVLGDGKSVADLFLTNSEHSCRNPDEFRKDMINIVDDARKNIVSLGQVDVGILLQQLLSLLMQHRIRLEPAMSSVVLAVFILEGLGRSLDPEMDILERARPLLVTGM